VTDAPTFVAALERRLGAAKETSDG
jgi:hypothetical protein